jgi:catechol 2,3-dioxygenase-like lactoylglutathione lyase family enzyme
MKHDVGGVELDRPFHVQRLGHFAIIADDQRAQLQFFCDALGMQISDTVDFAEMFGRAKEGCDGNAYFLRFGGDHHSLVIFPRWCMPGRPGGLAPGTESLGHIAWQVGTMKEVIDGGAWLRAGGCTEARPGTRDPAGANYNSTFIDPCGLPNEIYYGMDQIGWDGLSKPAALWPADDLALPPSGGAINADYPVVANALSAGLALRPGTYQRSWPSERCNVDGVMLARPFRIVRNSPIGLFVPDMAQALDFYRDRLGLTLTESTQLRGNDCHFLRAGTEHHAIALFPLAVRTEMGHAGTSLCSHYGMQLQNYRQLRGAIDHLRKQGVRLTELPPEMIPGIDFAVLAEAPEGHGILLYCYMEQIGWDGRPRPAHLRRKHLPLVQWPATVPELSDSYRGAVIQGPIG